MVIFFLGSGSDLDPNNGERFLLKIMDRTGKHRLTCGQSYKASTIVIYDSRVVPDLKIPHITTLES